MNKPVDTHKFSSAIDIEVNEHTGEITSIKADGKEVLRTPMHFNIIRFTDNDRDLVPHWIGRCHLDACKYMAVKDLFKVTAEQPFSFSVNPYTTKQLFQVITNKRACISGKISTQKKEITRKKKQKENTLQPKNVENKTKM